MQIIFIIPRMQSEMRISLLKRRLHTDSEDNIRVTQRVAVMPKRVRLNTIQNEEDLVNQKLSLVKNASRGILSPIKFYESRLTLSSESWAAYSFSERIYKRGWRPNKTVIYSCFIRILLLRVWYDLKKTHPIIDKVWVRTNRYILSAEEKKRALLISEHFKLKQLEKKQPSSYKLAQNTFILLKDLVLANLYENREQLNQYTIAFLGSLLLDIEKGTLDECKVYSFQEPSEGQLSIEQVGQAIKAAIDKVKSNLKDWKFTDCRVSQSCQFQCSPEQMTRIFADLIRRYPQTLKTISKKEMIVGIKYQMGYRFYEERKLKFTQDWNHFQDHIMLRYRGKNNFQVISFNKRTQHILALYDCKFGMEETDLRRIDQFLAGIAKPIVAKKGIPVKLLPILKLTD